MIGKTLAHYEITELLGKGGMGEVYRARDTKLDREVAVKLLPDEVAADGERFARFRREAKVLASLNHPNIAAIYGLENADDKNFLVMELADGEDLASRLQNGPVPIPDAIEIAAQVARGLEEAHEKGIVHRDLKPANVMVTREGKVKILDFGLAMAYSGNSGDEADLQNSPTITAAMTQAGVILGTAAYMSPEQAKGKTVDRRADIWSFGVILFEMVTGKSLFGADTVSECVASVLMRPIDWSLLPDDVPAGLRALMERCLERDPQTRLRDIGEARVHLQNPAASTVLSAPLAQSALPLPEEPKRASRLAWVLVAVLAIALAVALRGALSDAPISETRTVFSALEPPVGTGFHLAGTNPTPAKLSPDGTKIVYGARGERGNQALWLQELDRPEPRMLPSTDGAQYPFWSPDSRAVAFFAAGGLMVLELSANGVREVASAPDVKGGCWLPGDQLIFPLNATEPLSRLALNTGELTIITDLEAEPVANSHRLPRELDDNSILFAARLVDPGSGPPVAIMAQRLDGSPARELIRADAHGEFARGHLLYVISATLFARPLDVGTLTFTGPAQTLATDVGQVPGAALALFSTSAADELVYHPGYATTIGAGLAWFDENGDRIGALEMENMGNFDLSPDNRRLAIDVWDNRGLADVWLHDLETEVSSRLTFEAGIERTAQWGPKGERLYYLRTGSGSAEIVSLEPESRAEPQVVRQWKGEGNLGAINDVSSDGTTLSIVATDSTTGLNRVYLLSSDGSGDPVIVDDVKTATELGQFSPDGRWIAYAINEGGGWNVYLKTNPPTSRKWQITTDAAFWYVWDPSGNRIYFYSQASGFYSIELDLSGNTPRIGQTELVFREFPNPVTVFHDIAVSSDSKTFYVTDAASTDDARPLRLIQGWSRLLKPQP